MRPKIPHAHTKNSSISIDDRPASVASADSPINNIRSYRVHRIRVCVYETNVGTKANGDGEESLAECMA